MKRLFFLGWMVVGMTALAKSQLHVNVQWQKQTTAVSRDTLFYNDHSKLTWDNFFVKKDEGNNTAALTTSGFGFTAGIYSRSGKGTLDINVFCYFLPSKSWVKDGHASEYILNHEQHHFDISYIGTCVFMKKLREAKINTNNYSSILTKIYNETYEYMSNMQDSYDNETNNGMIKERQDDWNRKVTAMLADL